MAVAQKLSGYRDLDLVSRATEYLKSNPQTAQRHLERIKECVPVLIAQLKEYEKARSKQRDELLEEEKNVLQQIGAKEQEMNCLWTEIRSTEGRRARYEALLEDARSDLRRAEDKKRNVESKKDAAIGRGGGVGAVILGVLFPPSLAVTVPAATSFAIAITEADKAIDRSRSNIFAAESSIREENSKISSANSNIAQLNGDIMSLSSRRNLLHEKVTKMRKTTVFLQKATTFLGQLAAAVKGGGNETEFLHTIVDEANKHEEYEILRDDGCTVIVNSFAAAWKEVEKQLSTKQTIGFLSI